MGMPQLYPALAKPRNGEVLAKAFSECHLTVGSSPADKGQVEPVLKVEPELRSRALPCVLIDKLGIEHQAIHVQDDGSDGCDYIRVSNV
jgi:hypothetical protein